MNNLSKRRYEWLDDKELTMPEIARSLDEDFGTVYKWFRFGRTPRRHSLEHILKVYPDWPR